MPTLGMNGAIEINVFLSSVNARVNAMNTPLNFNVQRNRFFDSDLWIVWKLFADSSIQIKSLWNVYFGFLFENFLKVAKEISKMSALSCLLPQSTYKSEVMQKAMLKADSPLENLASSQKQLSFT